MGKFTKLLILVVAAASVGVLANFSTTNAYAADCGGADFCGTLDFGPIAVATDATNTSHILGFYGEFYIEHPLYVSARQSPIGEPTDPADVQGAFLNKLFYAVKYCSILKYLSPVSGKITTTRFPFPKSLATLSAAKVAAPAEIPTNKPSSLAKRLVIRNA